MKLKDKKIQIFSVIVTKDPKGFTIETLELIALPLWTYFHWLSGKEFFAVSAVQHNEECLFITNYCNNIT